MKKILLSLIIFLSVCLYANQSNFSGNILSPSSDVTSGLAKEIKGKKTYNELIKALETSPSAEHKMYLGIIYLNGMVIPDAENNIIKPDIKKAVSFFNKAIEGKFYQAAQILGGLYLYHPVLSKEQDKIEKAIKYLKIALDNNLYDGSTLLAQAYFAKNEFKKGIKVLSIGAEHNVASSELMLAMLYQWGLKYNNVEYIHKDSTKANILLSKACSNKNKTAFVKDFCSSSQVEVLKQNKSSQ
jgi:TPR repeat protein